MMIIDGQRVITGSFNFTTAAQNHNAEIAPTPATLRRIYV